MTTAQTATLAQLETDLATARATARAAWKRADYFGDTNLGFELRCAAGELERAADAIAERIEEAHWNDLEVEDGATWDDLDDNREEGGTYRDGYFYA